MINNVIKYLTKKNEPASSTELAKTVLKTNHISEQIATQVILPILENDPRIQQSKDGLWFLLKRDKNEAQNFSDQHFALLKCFPCRVSNWREWHTITLSLLDKDHIENHLWEFNHSDRRQSTHLLKAIHEILSIIGDYPVVMDGFGNQLSMFRNASFQVLYAELKNNIISLKRICQLLFPQTRLKDEADLSTFLGMRAFEQSSPEIAIQSMSEQFLVLLHNLQQAKIKTMEEWENFYAGDMNQVDFSPYAFDRSFIENLPAHPGVYIMKNNKDEIIYIGKAKKLVQRVSSYFLATSQMDAKLNKIRQQLYQIEIEQTGTELEALLREYELIKKYDPPINRQIHVHRRQKKQKTHYSRILICPSADNDQVKLFLFEPDIGVRVFDLQKDRSNDNQLKTMVNQIYFSGEKPREHNIDFENIEILTSWLALNEEKVNSIDMRKVSSLNECTRLINDHVNSLDSSHERVIHY